MPRSFYHFWHFSLTKRNWFEKKNKNKRKQTFSTNIFESTLTFHSFLSLFLWFKVLCKVLIVFIDIGDCFEVWRVVGLFWFWVDNNPTYWWTIHFILFLLLSRRKVLVPCEMLKLPITNIYACTTRGIHLCMVYRIHVESTPHIRHA